MTTKIRFLSRKEVLAKIPLTYPHIWDLMRKGKFPRSRQVGEKRVGWIESEIDEWMNARPVVTLKGDDEKAA
jgi:prophage regulatory protein